MIKFIKNFRKDEDGAVTVDWVVLTAAVAALAGVAYTSISTGIEAVADNSEAQLSATSTALGTDALITAPTP